MSENKALSQSEVAFFAQTFGQVVGNIDSILKGKRPVITLATLCLFSGGHLLIEDIPGVGKTTLARGIAGSIGGTWCRVQFTPDLLPTDLTGMTIINQTTKQLEFKAGPLFANIVLGDEINRASPRTQSALLEAMEERQVTSDGMSRPLPDPFMVVATQNPIEHDGTFRLPESQLDRFSMMISIGYPDRHSEMLIMDPMRAQTQTTSAVTTPSQLSAMQSSVSKVTVADSLRNYIVDIAEATRSHPLIKLGMSPRTSASLLRVACAFALAQGRDTVWPDDIKAMAEPCLAHRMILSTEASLDGHTGSSIVSKIISSIAVPTSA